MFFETALEGGGLLLRVFRSQVANLRVEILIPDDGCYHADCNDHGHCKGGDRRDPPLKSSDGRKDAHDENNEHAKNNEADSPFPDSQMF